MYKYQRLVNFCILILYSTGVKARNAPIPIPCPEIFQYLSFGAEFIGLITLKQLPFRTTIVDVEFAQAEPISLTNFSAGLSLNQNRQTTRANLESGKPISYRIDFPNPYISPMLISIKVNGETICSSTELEHPSNIFKLQHIFETELPTTTISSVPIPRIFSAPVETKTSKPTTTASSFPMPRISSSHLLTETIEPTTTPSSFPMPQFISSRVFFKNGTIVHTVNPTSPEFPWLVGIFSERSNSSKYECDGSLISSRTVITTAHCFKTSLIDEHNLFVYLGNRFPFHVHINSVKRKISNSSAHYAEHYFDIVLLHMGTKVEFDQFIQPISLWSQSEDLTLVENLNGFIAVWAFDHDPNALNVTNLMVPVEIVDATNCRRTTLTWSSNPFCIQFNKPYESCIQAGTALMLKVSDVFVLRGIRSVILNCELKTFLEYYDLAKLTPWIRENMLN